MNLLKKIYSLLFLFLLQNHLYDMDYRQYSYLLLFYKLFLNLYQIFHMHQIILFHLIFLKSRIFRFLLILFLFFHHICVVQVFLLFLKYCFTSQVSNFENGIILKNVFSFINCSYLLFFVLTIFFKFLLYLFKLLI